MPIRKTIYQMRDQSVSLAFVADIPGHPEAGTEPPPPAAQHYFAGERRSPVMTEGRIRRALGKDREYSEKLRDKIQFEAVTRRIMREGW